jgi:hypothetical protein
MFVKFEILRHSWRKIIGLFSEFVRILRHPCLIFSFVRFDKRLIRLPESAQNKGGVARESKSCSSNKAFSEIKHQKVRGG